MAGATIKVTTRGERELGEAMARLAGDELVTAALKNIGQVLLKGTRERFSRQVDPEGRPWAPLNPEYAKGKRGGKILQVQGMRGGLLGSITAQLSGSHRLEVGTNKIYGAVHQFGATIRPRSAEALVFRLGGRLIRAKQVTIPARPYLGISAADRANSLVIVRDHIERRWQGN
jgi:phage virion morphogenesis protein